MYFRPQKSSKKWRGQNKQKQDLALNMVLKNLRQLKVIEIKNILDISFTSIAATKANTILD